MTSRMVLWGVAALAVALTSPAAGGGPRRSQNASQTGNIGPSKVVIKFRPGAAADERGALHRTHGHQLNRTIPQLDIHVVRVPPGRTADDVIARYWNHPLVEFAEAEVFMEPQLAPNDPWYVYGQIPLQQLSAEAAWDVTTGSLGVPIAVLDTGLDVNHYEFADRIASGGIWGYDFADDDPDFDDPAGHGTLVAGVIGAMANNDVGITGATWQSPIVVLRSAFGLDTIEAITWATDNGARVISMSYGGYTSTSWKEAAMQYAFEHGVVLVGAAGNDGSNQPFYPAAYPTVLSVTGVNSSGQPIGYNWGNWIDLSAPGGGVLTTYPTAYDQDGLSYTGGTSIAAPFVASAAGLVLSVNPELTPIQVMDILRSTADDLADPGFDELTGYGRVNFHAAVLVAANTVPYVDTTPPSVAITVPAAGEVVSGVITILAEASDDVSVSQVDLYVDGLFVSSDTVSPHEWAHDTADVVDGEHTLWAVAHDTAGYSTGSAPVQVTVDNATPPAGCDNDGVCEVAEDCATCPNDCLAAEGASCGNSVCEAVNGEDCLTCPEDCNGKQTGKASRRFCCGDGNGYNPVGCLDARCTGGGFACTADPVADSCCGDGSCTGLEDGFNCEIDCGPPPVCADSVCDVGEDSCTCPADCGDPPGSETIGASCNDGLDNDCDGEADCNDPDCAGDPSCPACDQDGVCEPGEDCHSCPTDCRGMSKGRRAGRFCCGNSVLEKAEADGTVCDGNP